MVGGVRSNFRTDCPFPFLCRDCKEIFTGDLYAYQNPCGECNGENTVSYEDRSVTKDRGLKDSILSTTVYSWMTLPLEPLPGVEIDPPNGLSMFQRIKRYFYPPVTPMRNLDDIPRAIFRDAKVGETGHLCPKCEEFSLGFSLRALLD